MTPERPPKTFVEMTLAEKLADLDSRPLPPLDLNDPDPLMRRVARSLSSTARATTSAPSTPDTPTERTGDGSGVASMEAMQRKSPWESMTLEEILADMEKMPMPFLDPNDPDPLMRKLARSLAAPVRAPKSGHLRYFTTTAAVKSRIARKLRLRRNPDA